MNGGLSFYCNWLMFLHAVLNGILTFELTGITTRIDAHGKPRWRGTTAIIALKHSEY